MNAEAAAAPAPVTFTFPFDTVLTLDAVHHRCDPKQGKEKTFLYVEYLMKVGGIMYTIETAPIDEPGVTDIFRSMTLGNFVSRWPKFRIYPRAGHWSNFSVDNEEKND